MKKGAAQRACALLAALALCAALGTGVFAEAAPGPAESPAASGVESAAQTQGQGQSGAGSEETADSALSHQPEFPADEPSLTEEGAQAAGDAEGQAGAEQDAEAQAALQAAAAPAPQSGASLAETTGLTITADDGQPLVQGVDYELVQGVATILGTGNTNAKPTTAVGTPANLIVLKTRPLSF